MIKSTGLSLAGARSEFFDKLSQVHTFPWERLAMTIKSDKESEKYRWLGSLPRVREWGTGRLAKGLRSESYDVENLKYESTIEWSRDEIADDQTGQIRVRIRQMAAAAARHKGYLLSQLLINGGTAGYNSYDGVSFFNDAHVSGASGSQDNDLTATAAAAAKTTAECKTAIQAAVAAGLAFLDDQAEPINEEVTTILHVVPPGLLFPMQEAVSAAQIGDTSNILTKYRMDVVPSVRRLNGTTFYTCFVEDGDALPFIFQDRESLEFKLYEADGTSETAFMQEVGRAGVRARYNMTYGFWQKAIRTVFNN